MFFDGYKLILLLENMTHSESEPKKKQKKFKSCENMYMTMNIVNRYKKCDRKIHVNMSAVARLQWHGGKKQTKKQSDGDDDAISASTFLVRPKV